MVFPIEHIRKLRNQARKMGLDFSVSFGAATDEEVQDAYNGIGSDKFKNLLEPTTRLFHIFEAAAMIHDWDWGPANNGTELSWKFSNHRFRCNCRILAANTPIYAGIFRPQIRELWRTEGDILADVVSSDMCLALYENWYEENSFEPGPERLS